MSEMQRNRGVIKRLSTKENAREVFNKLVADGIVEPKWCEFDDDAVHYIDHDDYAVVNGAIFDVSGAPDEGDGELDVNDAERLNATDYRIHAYYYNGGADLGEMLEESIPKADENYKTKKVFYAIKFKDGNYWSRGSNTSPSTFSTEGRARGTANSVSVGLDPESYDIVKLVEQ